MESDLFKLVIEECERTEKYWNKFPKEEIINKMTNYIEVGWILQLNNVMVNDNSPNLYIQQFNNINLALKAILKSPIEIEKLNKGIQSAEEVFYAFIEVHKEQFFQESNENKGLIMEPLVSIMVIMRFLSNEFNKVDMELKCRISECPIDLSNIYFVSEDHLRYENGIHISGPHGGAKRAIKIESNIMGMEGYTVTIFNLQGIHPFWGNNIQMAPKRMKVVSSDKDKIVLRGYGNDPKAQGAPEGSFANYGLTIFISNDGIDKIIAHVYDRNIDIEYIK